MFSSKKETNVPVYDKVDTLIGKTANFKGNLHAAGTVRVEGCLEGELKIDGDVVIGESGKVIGNVIASNAHIGGKIEGNICIKGQVHLTPSSSINGDIEVGNLIVDEGAVFTGKCIMINKITEPVPHNNKPKNKPENKNNLK